MRAHCSSSGSMHAWGLPLRLSSITHRCVGVVQHSALASLRIPSLVHHMRLAPCACMHNTNTLTRAHMQVQACLQPRRACCVALQRSYHMSTVPTLTAMSCSWHVQGARRGVSVFYREGALLLLHIVCAHTALHCNAVQFHVAPGCVRVRV